MGVEEGNKKEAKVGILEKKECKRNLFWMKKDEIIRHDLLWYPNLVLVYLFSNTSLGITYVKMHFIHFSSFAFMLLLPTNSFISYIFTNAGECVEWLD